MSTFEPIKASADTWGDPGAGVRRVDETQQQDITDLLMGHKVAKVDDEHLVLDNGTVIKAIGHDGGCACNAGCYDLSVLNGVDNIITRVEFDYRPHDDGTPYGQPDRSGHPDDPTDEWEGYYRIFVYADNQQINLMQVNGTDGNGYYGTGFELLVRDARGGAA